jgi:hypothetical protein
MNSVFCQAYLKKNELELDFLKVFNILRHWPIRHIRCPIWKKVHHWLAIGPNYVHSAKGDFLDFIMEERLDDVGELTVPNL